MNIFEKLLIAADVELSLVKSVEKDFEAYGIKLKNCGLYGQFYFNSEKMRPDICLEICSYLGFEMAALR